MAGTITIELEDYEKLIQRPNIELEAGLWTGLKLWQRIILSPLYALIAFVFCLQGKNVIIYKDKVKK